MRNSDSARRPATAAGVPATILGLVMATAAMFRGAVEGITRRARPVFSRRTEAVTAQRRSGEPEQPRENRPWYQPRALWDLLRQAGSEWLKDKAPRLGAALAYYSIFSLAPFLIIVIAIAGLVFGAEAAQGQLAAQINDLVGEQGAQAVQAMVANADRPARGGAAAVIGVVLLLLGAAGLFGELQDALNTVWKVEAKPGRGVWGFVRDRFFSMTMVFGTAFLMLVSLVVNAALSALGSRFGASAETVWGHALNTVALLVVITALFAMIFRYLPDAKIAWRSVWLGAALTAVLFTIGKFLIGLYLGHSGTASAYGAAGSLAVLLIWVYYSAQIFLFGAELTKVYAERYGSHIEPAENAVRVTEHQRAEEGIPHG